MWNVLLGIPRPWFTLDFDAEGTLSVSDDVWFCQQAAKVGIRRALTTISGKIDTIDDFLDTEIAAIKAKTDGLTFTVAGVVDANIQRVNDVTVTGTGAFAL